MTRLSAPGIYPMPKVFFGDNGVLWQDLFQFKVDRVLNLNTKEVAIL